MSVEKLGGTPARPLYREIITTVVRSEPKIAGKNYVRNQILISRIIKQRFVRPYG